MLDVSENATPCMYDGGPGQAHACRAGPQTEQASDFPFQVLNRCDSEITSGHGWKRAHFFSKFHFNSRLNLVDSRLMRRRRSHQFAQVLTVGIRMLRTGCHDWLQVGIGRDCQVDYGSGGGSHGPDCVEDDMHVIFQCRSIYDQHHTHCRG